MLRGYLERGQAAARNSDLEFHRLLEKLPAAAYTCDHQGLITYFNPRAVDLWGREPKLNDPADRFCGSFKLFTPDGVPMRHERCWMARALLENKAYNGQEILVERPDGGRRTALAHANPFHDESGRVTGAVNVLVDISDRKQAEDLLRDADRRKDEFLATLAHELRNPLAPIRTGLELMKMAAADPAMVEEVRSAMQQQVEQLVRLVDDLLDVSRVTMGKVQLRKSAVDLASVVNTAVESLRPLMEKSDLKLTVDLPPQPLPLHADALRLSQVFCNLLNNAAKYTQHGGHIILTVERQQDEAVVAVRDTGIGIPPWMLHDIFEMFKQVDNSLERRHGGLGIGLTLVKRLVEMHDGTVEAQSEGPGRGSAFIVRLPLVEAPVEEQPPEARMAAPDAGGLRVLVADDNRAAARMLSLMVRLWGNEVRTVHDGQAALESAAVFRPDVMVLDVGMPKLNGYETAREIRAHDWGRETTLIALTGWGQDEDKRRSREAGFNHHLVKPMDADVLREILAAVAVKQAGAASPA